MCIYVNVCMYVCRYVICMYVCMICMYVCTHACDCKTTRPTWYRHTYLLTVSQSVRQTDVQQDSNFYGTFTPCPLADSFYSAMAEAIGFGARSIDVRLREVYIHVCTHIHICILMNVDACTVVMFAYVTVCNLTLCDDS
jgi:hypothetical protein